MAGQSGWEDRIQGTAMAISTRLTELLGVQHPILLAPMGLVADGRLAAAVSRAGGFGLIGGGYGDAEWLAGEMAAAGDARVGVGFIAWSMARKPGCSSWRWSASRRRSCSPSARSGRTRRR